MVNTKYCSCIWPLNYCDIFNHCSKLIRIFIFACIFSDIKLNNINLLNLVTNCQKYLLFSNDIGIQINCDQRNCLSP